jgi:hypothetical protein
LIWSPFLKPNLTTYCWNCVYNQKREIAQHKRHLSKGARSKTLALDKEKPKMSAKGENWRRKRGPTRRKPPMNSREASVENRSRGEPTIEEEEEKNSGLSKAGVNKVYVRRTS